jgi:excisionase family DNA binding protein
MGDERGIATGILTVDEAASRGGVSKQRIRYLLMRGRFPGALRLGRDWLIPEASYEHWATVDRDRRFKKEGG